MWVSSGSWELCLPRCSGSTLKCPAGKCAGTMLMSRVAGRSGAHWDAKLWSENLFQVCLVHVSRRFGRNWCYFGEECVCWEMKILRVWCMPFTNLDGVLSVTQNKSETETQNMSKLSFTGGWSPLSSCRHWQAQHGGSDLWCGLSLTSVQHPHVLFPTIIKWNILLCHCTATLHQEKLFDLLLQGSISHEKVWPEFQG